MGTYTISAVTTLFGFVIYLALASVSADASSQIELGKSHSGPALSRGNSVGYKRFLRSSIGAANGNTQRLLQISHSKIPIELDLLLDDDELFDKTKRYDDYGHMRFGKRGGEDQFDDYGHMRFGKRSD